MNRTNICKNIVQSIKDYITDQVKLEPHRVEKHFEELLGVRPHKEKINISKEFINKAKER